MVNVKNHQYQPEMYDFYDGLYTIFNFLKIWSSGTLIIIRIQRDTNFDLWV